MLKYGLHVEVLDSAHAEKSKVGAKDWKSATQTMKKIIAVEASLI